MYLNQVLPVEIFRIIDEFLFYDLYPESSELCDEEDIYNLNYDKEEAIIAFDRKCNTINGNNGWSDSNTNLKWCHYCKDYFEGQDTFVKVDPVLGIPTYYSNREDIIFEDDIYGASRDKTLDDLFIEHDPKYFNYKYYLCDSCSKYHERCNFLLMLGKHSLEMRKTDIPNYLKVMRGDKRYWSLPADISNTHKIEYLKQKQKRDDCITEMRARFKTPRRDMMNAARGESRAMHAWDEATGGNEFWDNDFYEGIMTSSARLEIERLEEEEMMEFELTPGQIINSMISVSKEHSKGWWRKDQRRADELRAYSEALYSEALGLKEYGV
jgi:hypothetical protein